MRLFESAAWMCCCVGAVGGAAIGHAQSRVPDITLRVTVQQREGTRVNPGLHLLKLSCLSGLCTLESISLNQCSPSPVTGNPSFAAVVERSSTAEGNLRVTNLGNVLVVEERASDLGGASTSTFRFGYGQNPSRVTSVSGGFVKNSDIVGKIITVEYVPLIGAYSERKLDCVVRLPGVNRN